MIKMKIGRRIKNAFGLAYDVDYIMFEETHEHIVLIMVPYDMTITHKQVNAVLNQYPLGDAKNNWIFIDTGPAKISHRSFKYRSEWQEFLDTDMILVSRYRISKKSAMKALIEQEAKKAEEDKLSEAEEKKKMKEDTIPILDASKITGPYEVGAEVIASYKRKKTK